MCYTFLAIFCHSGSCFKTSGVLTMQKRKLSDMLGSQWSKEEIERFYEAYRKYGKDWRKV